MTYTLQVHMQKAEGSLIRVLGLVGRRGFDVVHASANSIDGGKAMELTVVITGVRPGEVLARQVEKLHDVRRVNLHRIAS